MLQYYRYHLAKEQWPIYAYNMLLFMKYIFFSTNFPNKLLGDKSQQHEAMLCGPTVNIKHLDGHVKQLLNDGHAITYYRKHLKNNIYFCIICGKKAQLRKIRASLISLLNKGTKANKSLQHSLQKGGDNIALPSHLENFNTTKLVLLPIHKLLNTTGQLNKDITILNMIMDLNNCLLLLNAKYHIDILSSWNKLSPFQQIIINAESTLPLFK
jgi:hypothetical protein